MLKITNEQTLGVTIKNHLEEFIKEPKWLDHCPRPFPSNAFITIVFYSCLSIACFNIWLEVCFGIKKWKLLKFCILNKDGPLKNS
jgi:hypothetical protein